VFAGGGLEGWEDSSETEGCDSSTRKVQNSLSQKNVKKCLK